MDREKVIKGLEQCKEGGSCDGCEYDIQSSKCIFMLHADALALLKEQPEIVRCKDCVYGKLEKNDSTGMTWIYCGHHRENRPEDWFCASGSRIQL